MARDFASCSFVSMPLRRAIFPSFMSRLEIKRPTGTAHANKRLPLARGASFVESAPMPAPDPLTKIKELEAALAAAKSGAEETIKSLQARLEDTRAEKALFERTVAQRAKERDEARKERDELRRQLGGAQTGRLAPELPKPTLAAAVHDTGTFQKELAQAKEQLKTRDQELARARSDLAAKDQELAQARLELRARAAELDS